MASQASDYYSTNRESFLAGLIEFLRIPSISTLPRHASDIAAAADFLVHDLNKAGLQNAGLIEGLGNPLVTAEWRGAERLPTLLIYGHYDVQPADPLDEWRSPPFEPEIRGDDLFARGAADDKGQVYLLIKAVEGLLKRTGKLPVNVMFLIEGEEECGGQAVTTYLERHGAELAADAVLICDTEMFAPGLPTLCVGLRGIVYAEIEVTGAATDLHSGVYGGAAPNALEAAAQMIAGLKQGGSEDATGRILIPEFYDHVDRPAPAELEAWEKLPFDEERYRRDEIGSPVLTGESGYSVLERTWARPSLDVHGIRGGFVDVGAKTVIPARATVKVSMRLVPSMDPGDIYVKFEQHVRRIAPPGIHVETRLLYAAPASVVDPENPFVRKAAGALRETFGRETVFIRSGGSIPVVSEFDNHAGIPSVLMGFGLPDDNIHAPNEKFHLPNFYHGIEAVGRYLEMLGA